MPIKPDNVFVDMRRGDPITASWLNKLKSPNISGTSPIVVSQQAGNYVVSLDMTDDWFLGEIASDAAATSSDATYYVRRQTIVTATKSDVGFQLSDVSDFNYPSDTNYRVVNLPELRPVYSDCTHTLAFGQPVVVTRVRNKSFPESPKYIMWSPPQAGTFPVKVTQSDGVAGDSDTNCTFDYRVANLSGKVIGHKLTPLWPRYSDTTYVAPAAGSYGVAFYDGKTLRLWQTLEQPQTSDCG